MMNGCWLGDDDERKCDEKLAGKIVKNIKICQE
jgi:hypothetical protein